VVTRTDRRAASAKRLSRADGKVFQSAWFLRGAVALVVLGLWQLIGDDSVRLAMPTFVRTVRALTDLVADGSLSEGLFLSNQALVAGFGLALLVGIPLGLLMGSVKWLRRLAEPYLSFVLAVPMIALVPVIQVAFGLTLTARIVVVFLFSFVYVAINAMVGVSEVDPSLKEMARSFGASTRHLVTVVVLPGAIPAIMAGIRLGLGRAMVGMVVAELTLIGSGLGSLIIDYQFRFEPGYVLAIVLVILVEAVVLMELAKRFEQRVSRWKGSEV
jgi:ABC-type nitrate/sulfonate/bicarbonate transport system permease component